MTSAIETRLAELQITLPQAAAPVANYVPTTISGNLLFVSGQIPFGADGKIAPAHIGKLGGGVSDEDGKAAARQCAINLLAQARAALGGDLSRLKRCLRLGGFVNVTPDYTAVPPIINGASDLMVAAMGDGGRHARFAVGVAQLPLGVAVEVDATFEIE